MSAINKLTLTNTILISFILWKSFLFSLPTIDIFIGRFYFSVPLSYIYIDSTCISKLITPITVRTKQAQRVDD